MHSYDDVAHQLAKAGCRCIIPYLRGYGETRFLSPDTPRSGQQAALAEDLRSLMDALEIERAIVAGYDWGGRAAVILSAIYPERVIGLVTAGVAYNLQDIAGSVLPQNPLEEHRLWYQYYFHAPRGQAGLQDNRYDLCKLLWQLWSPTWEFKETTYAQTAKSFENPDFVDVVIQSYRHRFGLVAGDPAYETLEKKLADQPDITVPTIALLGADDGVSPPPENDANQRHFTGPYDRRIVPGAGHNLPQEKPKVFAQAVLDLI